MKVGVPREGREGERRVAATPETVGQLRDLGVDIEVEAGAGVAAGYPDAAYAAAGAQVVPTLDIDRLDAYCHVRPLTPEQAARLRRGTITIGLASPASELDTVAALAEAGVTAFALELVPRISRAQSMDALSSQVARRRLPLRCSRRPSASPGSSRST